MIRLGLIEAKADTLDLELKSAKDESVEAVGMGYTPSLLNPL